MMNCDNFGDPLKFPRALSLGQSICAVFRFFVNLASDLKAGFLSLAAHRWLMSLMCDKFFFCFFFTPISKTGAELQWHIMCYSQETLICGSRNNEWKLQHVQCVICIICCDLKKNVHQTVFQKGTRTGKRASAADQPRNFLIIYVLSQFSLWSLIKKQTREHPILILSYSKSKKKK